MRNTFLAMVMMAGVAVGQSDSFTLTSAGEYDEDKKYGATVSGVIFTLKGESCERYTFAGGELPDSVTLSSITIREREATSSSDVSRDFSAGTVMFITDTENAFLGVSAPFVKEEGSDYALFNFGDSITLSSGTTYCAYFTASATAASLKVGQQITSSVCISQALASVGGSYDENSASDWGLLNQINSISSIMIKWAPDMTIQLATAPIPEPGTAALSLLALAGLAARRRR